MENISMVDLFNNSNEEPVNSTEIKELERLIVHHRKMYFAGAPEIPDEEYDKLEERLRTLSPENRLFMEVGSDEVLKGSTFVKVSHEPRMLSLNKVYSLEEFMNWLPEGAVDGVITPKVDGFAVKLIYRKEGDAYTLVLGATRGNGSVGEDVTENIRQVRDIPHVIPANVIPEGPEEFQVRGECFMKKSIFEKFNSAELGFESCRNIAPGSIRNKNPRVTRERKLNFFAYNILGLGNQTFIDGFIQLEKCGFVPVEYRLIDLRENPEQEFKAWDQRRRNNTDDYFVDGIVFIVNDLEYFEQLGNTAHHPRAAVAWKFKAEEAETVLREIQWQVSRTGLINPVGIYDKVFIEGANLTNATLHNLSQIKELGLGIGDTIIVARQGGVIPKILQVVESAGNGIVIPEKCPECNETVFVKDEKGIETLHCTNRNCPAVIKARIVHFISVMEIEDIAESIISKLYDAGLVRDPADIYKLREEDFLSFYKSGEKIASKLVQNIRLSKQRPLHMFLHSLGIPTLGQKLSEDLAMHYKTLDNLLSATEEDLVQIDGVADEKARNIVAGLKENRTLIDKLIQEVEITNEEPAIDRGEQLLAGKSFLITGTLSKPRKEIESLIKNNGGTIKSSVSKSLDYLIVGESPGSKKDKAEKAGVEIINEEKLHNLLNNK
jgi:DNA ligase (NAD+)